MCTISVPWGRWRGYCGEGGEGLHDGEANHLTLFYFTVVYGKNTKARKNTKTQNHPYRRFKRMLMK